MGKFLRPARVAASTWRQYRRRLGPSCPGPTPFTIFQPMYWSQFFGLRPPGIGTYRQRAFTIVQPSHLPSGVYSRHIWTSEVHTILRVVFFVNIGMLSVPSFLRGASHGIGLVWLAIVSTSCFDPSGKLEVQYPPIATRLPIFTAVRTTYYGPECYADRQAARGASFRNYPRYPYRAGNSDSRLESEGKISHCLPHVRLWRYAPVVLIFRSNPL